MISARPTVYCVNQFWLLFVFIILINVCSPELVAADQRAGLTLEDCISIAFQRQAAIQVKQSESNAAAAQVKIAKSYRLPEITASSRLTHLDQPITAHAPTGLEGQTGELIADGAAFFEIARLSNTATALSAFDNPNVPLFPGGPSFNSARQVAAAQIPLETTTNLLGETFLRSQILLVQPLWTGGRISKGIRKAELGSETRALGVAKSHQQTIFNVTQAYLTVQLAKEILKVGIETKQQFKALEDVTQSFVDSGDPNVSVADVTRARTLRLLTDAQNLSLDRTVLAAKAALKEAMGVEQSHDFDISKSRPLSPQIFSKADTVASALLNRPELKQLRNLAAIQQIDVEISRAQFHPTVAAFGSISTINDNRDFRNPNDQHERAVGAAIDMPIFAGGRRLADVKRAKWEHSAAAYQLRKVEQLVALEATTSYLAWEEAQARVPVAKEAMENARVSLERYYDLFAGDLVLDEDLAEYFQDRQTARILLTQAEIGYHQALFDLDVALARLKLVRGEQ